MQHNNKPKTKNGSSRQERAPKQNPKPARPASKAPRVPILRNMPMQYIAPEPRNGYGIEIADRFGTSDREKVAQAYLNVGHASNYQSALPLPDSYPGRRYMFKSQWRTSFTIPSVGGAVGDRNLGIYSIPFFEYPFMVVSGNSYRGIQQSECNEGLGPTPLNYLKSKCVYAFRCLGKTMTITNETSAQNKSGGLIVNHKSPDLDVGSAVYTDTSLRTTASNQWTMQAMPLTTEAISRSGNYYQTVVPSDGAYVQAHHAHNNWSIRDGPINKLNGNYAQPQVAADISNKLKMWDDNVGTDRNIVDYNNPTLSCLVGGPDNTDIAVAMFDGLTQDAVITVKFTVVYEFILKANSPFMRESLPAPIYDPNFINALVAYETYRSSLAGGGTLRAIDNDWNEIWSGFKRFISNMGGVVRNVAANFGMTDVPSTLRTLGKVAPYAMAML